MNKSTFQKISVSSLLFMLGLTLSAFIIANISDVAYRVDREIKWIDGYSFSKIFWIRCDKIENLSERSEELSLIIINNLLDKKCNTSLYHLPVSVEHQIQDVQIDLVMRSNDVNSKYKSGIQNAAYIGESVAPMISDNLEKYLDIGGHEIIVAGILENHNPAKIDHPIQIYWDDCSEDFQQYLVSAISNRLNDSWLQIRFFSENPIENDVTNFIESLDEISLYCEEYIPESFSDRMSYWYRILNTVTLPIFVLFAVGSCIISSNLWFASRKKEFAIRRAYGFSHTMIFRIIIKNIFVLSMPAILTAFFLHFISCALTHSMDYFYHDFLIKVLFIFTALVIIIIICAINIMRSINKITISQVLKEE